MSWETMALRAVGVVLVLPVVTAAARHWTRKQRSDWAEWGACLTAALLVGLAAPLITAGVG